MLISSLLVTNPSAFSYRLRLRRARPCVIVNTKRMLD
jgi:hypothetical protein